MLRNLRSDPAVEAYANTASRHECLGAVCQYIPRLQVCKWKGDRMKAGLIIFGEYISARGPVDSMYRHMRDE